MKQLKHLQSSKFPFTHYKTRDETSKVGVAVFPARESGAANVELAFEFRASFVKERVPDFRSE